MLVTFCTQRTRPIWNDGVLCVLAGGGTWLGKKGIMVRA